MEAKELLNQYFLNTIHLRVRKQLLCAIVPSCYTGKHIFDLYFFKKTMEYGDENVQAVLFIGIGATSDGKICDGDHDRGNSVQDIRSEKKLPL